MSTSALQLGMVEAAPAIHDAVVEKLFEGDAREAWRQMRKWHDHAAKHGLADSTLEFDEIQLVEDVLDCAQDALRRRGRGEEIYLDSVRARVEARVNPGQEATALHGELGDTLALIRALAVAV